MSLCIIIIIFLLLLLLLFLLFIFCLDEEKKEEQLGFQNNGFNQFRSDRIPLDREIPDTRDSRYVM